MVGFVGNEQDMTEIKIADKLKTEFIAMASHQLRTPITVMR